MYNAKYIIPGILVFLALAFLPVAYNKGKTFEVKPELPRDYKECIEDTQVMLVPAGAKAAWKRTPRPYFQTSTFSSDSRKVTAWGTPVLTLCRVMGCCSTSMVWLRRRSLGGVNSTVT